ncbi:adaptin medium chain homolog Apm2p [Monosporozyma servazzii]
MTSALYVLSENLESLICKNIKALPSIEYPVQQFQKVYQYDQSPVIDYQNIMTFVHIRRDSLIFLAVVDRLDSFIMEILSYLDHFYELLKSYLDVKRLDKRLLLDNCTLVMELIDESLDYGVIQVTDSGIMRDYIRIKVNVPELSANTEFNVDDTEICSCSSSSSNGESDDDKEPGKSKQKKKNKSKHKHKHEKHKKKTSEKARKEIEELTKSVVGTLTLNDKNKKKKSKHDIEDMIEEEDASTFMNSDIAKTTIMAVSWRTKGIHYAKNEFFLDVVEKVEYLMDFTNNVIRKNSIHGEIVCKSFLSGMPTLKVSINKILDQDKQFLTNCKFHQCVATEDIEKAKEIEFIPPDGPFVLCRYDLKRHVRDEPLVKLTSFEIKPKFKKFKLKLYVTIETHFKTTNSTSQLNLKIPIKHILHDYTIDLSKNIKFKCDEGRILFNVSDDFLLWEIDSMKGGHGGNKLNMGVEFALFNKEEYIREQEELKTSMNPPPLREGPKLEELYRQVHGNDPEDHTDDLIAVTQPAPVIDQPVTKLDDNDRLLKLSFEIPYLTASGLKIEYLKIEEPQLEYQSFPWVRYKIVSDPEYTYLIY